MCVFVVVVCVCGGGVCVVCVPAAVGVNAVECSVDLNSLKQNSAMFCPTHNMPPPPPPVEQTSSLREGKAGVYASR